MDRCSSFPPDRLTWILDSRCLMESNHRQGGFVAPESGFPVPLHRAALRRASLGRWQGQLYAGGISVVYSQQKCGKAPEICQFCFDEPRSASRWVPP